MKFNEETLRRFEAKLIKAPNGQCWGWTAAVDGQGRPKLKVNGKFWVGARFSYTVFKGEIPADAVVRHSCDNGRCCNPDHLLVGTQAENVADRDQRGRTPRGDRHYIAKLTAESVSMARSSPKTTNALARELGVCWRTMNAARTGATWNDGQLLTHHPKKKAA